MKRFALAICFIIAAVCVVSVGLADASTHIYQLSISTYLDNELISYISEDPSSYETDDGEDDIYLLRVSTYHFYVTGDDGQIRHSYTFHLYFYYKNGNLYKVEVW